MQCLGEDLATHRNYLHVRPPRIEVHESRSAWEEEWEVMHRIFENLDEQDLCSPSGASHGLKQTRKRQQGGKAALVEDVGKIWFAEERKVKASGRSLKHHANLCVASQVAMCLS